MQRKMLDTVKNYWNYSKSSKNKGNSNWKTNQFKTLCKQGACNCVRACVYKRIHMSSECVCVEHFFLSYIPICARRKNI